MTTTQWKITHWPLLLLATALGSGCQPSVPEPRTQEQAAAGSGAAAPAPPAIIAADEAAPAGAAPAAAASGRQMVVYKSPTCGCCLAWADQMQAAGFDVEVRDVDDLGPIKRQFGVPASSASCHTAQVGDYFIEGHVPAEDIERLLAERPAAKGLAVPGMPLGSPGMEVPDGRTQPYDVLLIGADGSSQVFASHGRSGD